MSMYVIDCEKGFSSISEFCDSTGLPKEIADVLVNVGVLSLKDVDEKVLNFNMSENSTDNLENLKEGLQENSGLGLERDLEKDLEENSSGSLDENLKEFLDTYGKAVNLESGFTNNLSRKEYKSALMGSDNLEGNKNSSVFRFDRKTIVENIDNLSLNDIELIRSCSFYLQDKGYDKFISANPNLEGIVSSGSYSFIAYNYPGITASAFLIEAVGLAQQLGVTDNLVEEFIRLVVDFVSDWKDASYNPFEKIYDDFNNYLESGFTLDSLLKIFLGGGQSIDSSIGMLDGLLERGISVDEVCTFLNV